VLNYDNAIKDAQLQNNSLLAKIAYQALEASLEASIAAAQQKNSLLQAMVGDKIATNSLYDNRWRNLLDQKNTELARAEAARQFNANYQLELDKFNYQKQQDAAARAAAKAAATIKKSTSKSKSGGKYVKGGNIKTSNTKKIGSGAGTPIAPKSYSEAVAMLNRNGIEDDGGLMTKDEWSRRKTSGSNRAPAAYDSYAAYLSAYVTWALGNT
jgi:hypothetical protein